MHGDLGQIVCGLGDIAVLCLSVGSVGLLASEESTNVIFLVPFSPNMTKISESVNVPSCTVNLEPPSVFVLDG